MRFLLPIVYLLISPLLHLSSEVTIDQSTFITRMKQLANDQLGINKFQQFIDDQRNSKVIFSNSIPNGQALAAQIANDVEQSIQNHISAVRRIQAAYNYGQPYNQIVTDLCCDLQNLVYDSSFQRPVDVSNVCHLTRLDMSINNDVKNAMIYNLQQLPNIRWQFYGTEDGHHCTYPARNLCNETFQFDPRNRPWYTSTVNVPRDIVILLDRSTPMGESYSSGQSTLKLTVARNAAAAILNYLNPNDRVAVLQFSNTIMSVNDTNCFGRELAVANSDNIQQLLHFVMYGIYPDNSETRAKFELAFESADRIFKASDADAANTLFSDREKIILMLTAGNPSEDCQYLRNLGRQLFNDSVNIFMMEISPGFTSQTNCLRNLTAGPHGAHGFVPNSDFNDLRGKLGFFYNAFINEIDRTNVTFSVPFVDVNGLGLATSVCLPLFSIDQQLTGVTCIQIPFAEILRDIVNFRLNRLSYGFVVDKRGRVILHPLLPSPTHWQDELPLLELKEIEISSYSFDVEKKIISGFPGSQTLPIKRFTLIGQSDLQGVLKFETTATYYWNPIPSMKFFLCLVIVQNETKSSLAWTAGLSSVFLSDEMDLSANGKCSSYNRIILNNTGTTVVKLAPKTFESAESYEERSLSPAEISQLKQYITWKGTQPQGFSLKDGIRDVIATTSVLDSYWIPSTMDIQMKQNIMAMYIGTPDGVYRRFPIIRIPKSFDPTTQPWYNTAVSQTGQLILTLPYVDYASQLPLISLSQTVFTRSSAPQHSSFDPLIGVMGMDITVKYLYNMLTSTITQCSTNECFVIDMSGFIVIHKDLQRTIPSDSLHVTVREKAIAYDLTRVNILSPDACVNYVEQPLEKQLFWKTIVSFDTCQQLSTCTVCKVRSSDIDTNLFLIIKQTDSRSNGNCACKNQTDVGQSCTYDLSAGNMCQCPCKLPVNYDSCLLNINIDPSTWKPCIPSEESVADASALASEEKALLKTLQPCLSCSFFTDQQLCEANECCWLTSASVCNSTTDECEIDKRNTGGTSTLSNAYWTNSRTTTVVTSTNNSVELGLAIGLTLGLVLLAAVTILILVKCYQRRKRPSPIKTYNDVYEVRKDHEVHITTITVKDEDSSGDINGSYSHHPGAFRNNVSSIASVV